MLQKHDLKRVPTIVVDDFFDNPDEIRDRGLSHELNKAEQGHFAGKRTKNLIDIDPELHHHVVSRYLNTMYNLEAQEVNVRATSHFHLIDSVDDKDSTLNKSWIHIDSECIAAGIIYLTPNADADSGTSLFRLKDGVKIENMDTSPRILFHHLGEAVDNYEQKLEEHNDKFEETLNVKNVYNRLASYDGSRWHAANTYWTGTDPRLTLVFFLYELESPHGLPLERMTNMPVLTGS